MGKHHVHRPVGQDTLHREATATSIAPLGRPRAMPKAVVPMRAHAAAYPPDEGAYAFEVKWDGIRAIAHVQGGRVRLASRNLNDITAQYPELARIGDALVGLDAVLDGEIVAFDGRGVSSFQRLQGRLGVTAPREALARSLEIPVVFVAFDILHLDGLDVTGLPYEERRMLLESLGLPNEAIQLSPAVVGEGRSLLSLPGLEGVVAKRLGSTYQEGARSRAWLKIKTQRRQEFVIGGWSPGKGARAGRLGALLVGVHEPQPSGSRLLYAGSVGTGFTDATLDALQARLKPLARATSPFAGPIDKKDARFVTPNLIAEVEFMEWTQDGKLRHPSFKGLRDDKDPKDVIRED